MTELTSITVNGITYDLAAINKMQAELKLAQSVLKDAKKAGIIKAAKAEPKERSADFNLLIANFLPVVESNKDLIAKLFTASQETAGDLTSGQDSMSFDLGETSDYQVILRSKSITKAKKKANDDVKKAKADREKKRLELVKEFPEATEVEISAMLDNEPVE